MKNLLMKTKWLWMGILVIGSCGPDRTIWECIDTCTLEDERQCVGVGTNDEAVRVCGYHDDDECLEWGAPFYCLTGEHCEAGECLVDPECQRKEDCPEGMYCEEEVCVIEPQCRGPEDCRADKVCENGVCVCVPEARPPEWTTVRLDSDDVFSFKPSLAVDSCGKPHVVFVEGGGRAAELVYASNWEGEWTTQKLTQNEWEDVYPNLEIDETDILHLTYTQNDYGNVDILYARNEGEGFSIPFNLTAGSGFQSVNSKHLVDPQGVIHLVYERRLAMNMNVELVYSAVLDNGKTTKSQYLTLAPLIDWMSDLAFGPEGLTVGFSSYRDGDFEVYLLNLWEQEDPLTQISFNESQWDDYVTIAYDPEGVLHVMYVDGVSEKTKNVVYTNNREGEFFEPIPVLDNGARSEFIERDCMTVDSKGIVHAAMWEFDENNRSDIVITHSSPEGFVEPVNITLTPDADEYYPRIAVDEAQNLHLVYWNGRGEVYYTVRGP